MTTDPPTPYATRFDRLRGLFARSMMDGDDLIVDSVMLDLAADHASKIAGAMEALGIPASRIDEIATVGELEAFLADVESRLLAAASA